MENKSENRICQNCKNDFTVDADDFNFYAKIGVPAPTFCPDCRFQNRCMFRNERTLYKRKCDMTGKDMVTIFAPDKEVKVFHFKDWYGDGWDPKEYGQDYDPSRNFFEQIKELQAKVPYPSLIVGGDNVNCEYVNHVGRSKDCYLAFNSDHCENVYYSEIVVGSKDSMDCTMLNKGELCYDVVDGNGSMIKYSENCDECVNTWFSKDCIGCVDCFGCVNQRKKSYCIWNIQYSREEYFEKLKEFDLESYSSIENFKKESRKFWLDYPRRFYHGRQNTKSTGDYIYYSKNARDVYQGVYLEDSRYCQFITTPSTKDCYDITEWGENIELCYNSITIGLNSQNIKFSFWASHGAGDVEYSLLAPGSRYCFGCVNLRKGEYCILNKQYSKEEYFKLKEKIIEDMSNNPYIDSMGRVWKYGDFFPYDLSPFDYNESFAYPYFRLSKEEALSRGFKWSERPTNQYITTVKAEDLPQRISEVDDSIMKEVIECKDCKKAFKIVEGELFLLRKMNVPLPRSCFMCRYYERLSRINPNKLWHRKCMKEGCDNEFETSYAPDRPEIIYCEKCYQQEVA